MTDLKKYVVHKANIMDHEGNKRGHGEIVSLDAKLSRRYGKLGFLRPFFEEEEQVEHDEEEDDSNGADNPVGRTKAKLARSRRSAFKSASAEVHPETASE